MKTNRLFPILTVLLCITSCNTYHKVNTRINRDGSMVREVSALGDSAFMAGNNNDSPFLFYPDDQWGITRYDSVTTLDFLDDKIKFNTKVERRFPSPEAFKKNVQAKEHVGQLVLPYEELKKQFRWFYTYYTYRTVYKNISDSLPIPLSTFLSDSEQRILFQGDMTTLEGRNGIEISDILDDISGKFENWFERCRFEILYDAVITGLQQSGENRYSKQLPAVRDSIFNRHQAKAKDNEDFTCETISPLLDNYFKTNTLSEFIAENKQKLEDIAEQRQRILALFENKLYFGLEMPGKVMDANTTLRDHNTLVWKVDAYRFLAHDYTLWAQSRSCNTWAFIVTALILLVAIYSFIRLRSKKRLF